MQLASRRIASTRPSPIEWLASHMPTPPGRRFLVCLLPCLLLSLLLLVFPLYVIRPFRAQGARELRPPPHPPPPLLPLLFLVFPLYVLRPSRARGARELGPTRYATMIDMPAC